MRVFLDRVTLDSDFYEDQGPSQDFMILWSFVAENDSIELVCQLQDKRRIDYFLNKWERKKKEFSQKQRFQQVFDFFDSSTFNKKNFNKKIEYVDAKDNLDRTLQTCNYYISQDLEQPTSIRLLVEKRQRQESAIRQETIARLEQTSASSDLPSFELAPETVFKGPTVMRLDNFLAFLALKFPRVSPVNGGAELASDVLEKLRKRIFSDKLHLITFTQAATLVLFAYLIYSSVTYLLSQERLSIEGLDKNKNLVNAKDRLGVLAMTLKKTLDRLGYKVQEKSYNPAEVLINKNLSKEDFVSILIGILIVLEALNGKALASTNADGLLTINSNSIQDVRGCLKTPGLV